MTCHAWFEGGESLSAIRVVLHPVDDAVLISGTMPALYPKIPHLPGSRTGPSDTHVPEARARAYTEVAREGLLVTVEEKLDGTSMVVARARAAEGSFVVAYGRDGRRAEASRNLGRRLFARWVRENETRFVELLGGGERIAGEWLAIAHGTRYALSHEPFVPFDLFLADGACVSRPVLAQRCGQVGLVVPYLVHSGAALAIAEADRRLGPRGHHGADVAEGLVYREETRELCRSIAKVVRATKVDGALLADHTGGDHVFCTWPGSLAWLREALSEDPEGRLGTASVFESPIEPTLSPSPSRVSSIDP